MIRFFVCWVPVVAVAIVPVSLLGAVACLWLPCALVARGIVWCWPKSALVERAWKADPPAKAWDALWGGFTYPKLPWFLRAIWICVAPSVLLVLLVGAQAGEEDGRFAWALLAATATCALIESATRHWRAALWVEMSWVVIEVAAVCAILTAALLAEEALGPIPRAIVAVASVEVMGFGLALWVASDVADAGLG